MREKKQWNSLSLQVREYPTPSIFQTHLRIQFYDLAFNLALDYCFYSFTAIVSNITLHFVLLLSVNRCCVKVIYFT